MEGKVFRERAIILRFIPDGVSIDDAAAGFASQMCWVTPAARGNCCCGCCWSALFAAAGNVRCGVLLWVLAGTFPLGLSL